MLVSAKDFKLRWHVFAVSSTIANGWRLNRILSLSCAMNTTVLDSVGCRWMLPWVALLKCGSRFHLIFFCSNWASRWLLSIAVCYCCITRWENTGGRASSRSASGYVFDHGCQFIAAADPEFQNMIDHWELEGAIEKWDARRGELDAKTNVFTLRNCDTQHAGYCVPASSFHSVFPWITVSRLQEFLTLSIFRR